ncbi:MAG: PqqD family peptide modification chaperone [Acidipropionibacterium sp.]|jgi:hypothetical protein|nr:PqqD family peptide modification chaperone [Acidipropionibacterium sp.]
MLVREGTSLLLYPDELIQLSSIGTAIVELTAEAISVKDLASALERRFGRPEGGSTKAATRSVVDQLIERGVLEVVDS